MVKVNTRKLNRNISRIYQLDKEAYDTVDNYVNYSDDGMIEGLVPIGDTGLYATPNEPADPTDCDRYPDSPYCGGNPFTRDPIALNPEIVINQCDIGVSFSPVLGFVKLPQFNLVYRKEECRYPPPEPTYELPDGSFDEPANIPFNSCTSNSLSLAIATQQENYTEEWTVLFDASLASSPRLDPPLYLFAEDKVTTTIENLQFPYTGNRRISKRGENGIYEVVPAAVFTVKITSNFKRNENWNRAYRPSDEKLEGEETQTYEVLLDPSTRFTTRNRIAIYLGDINAIRERLSQLRNTATANPINVYTPSGYIPNGYYYRQIINNIDIYCSSFTNDNNPPPPLDNRKCCMSCCPSNTDNNNDQLLKLLLKKVNKLSEIVGVDDYPVSVPQSLISKDNQIDSSKDIASLTQLFAWYVERFDEIVGQFEIPIEIKDTDVLKDGDQPATIKLPNIAEAIAELFMLAFQSQINTEVLINMTTRVLLEGGQDKQQNYISYNLLLALVDWAGFKTKDVKKDMNLLFTPGKNRLDEFLDESKQTVVVQELNEKFGLEVDMMRFRKAASILDSVFFRKINPDGDIKGQIMKYLLNSLDTSKKLDNVKDDENSDKSFEKFIEDAEVGFTQTPGISNSTEPYGRNFSARPRIRDLSQNQSNNTSGDA